MSRPRDGRRGIGTYLPGAPCLALLLCGCDVDDAATRVKLTAPDTSVPLARSASAPIASPDTTDAIWSVAGENADRVTYGVPQEAPLLALECTGSEPTPQLAITRMAPADEGAGALLALIGNGYIGRMAVDATRIDGQLVWHGAHPASSENWAPLTGLGGVTATVPGAGLVRIGGSALPRDLIARCRAER
ncbi:MAG: hypothetical protein V2J51_09705 [Erythrobacter sp.]|nr:hypothetical protein [Erythrobacter sp.]